MSFVPYSVGLRFYDSMPPRARRMVSTMMRPLPRRTLLGSGFYKRLVDLRSSEHWSAEELERYQINRLRAMLTHAEKSVPYYHDQFHRSGLDPSSADLRTLEKIPILTKDIVRNEYSRLVAVDFSEQAGEANTTGSTGRPLRFLLDQQTREIEQAAVWRHYLASGASGLSARIASFRGDFVSERASGSLWRWDGRVGELTFNTYALEPINVRRMADRLNRFRPEIIRGYPHSLYVLAKGMEASSISLDVAPKFVHTSSEQLPRFMRETIENSLGCPIYDWYGQSENVISAGECAEGSYHQTMEAGIVRVVEDGWGMERVIGTSLWNKSMPLINYDVGDHVAIGDGCSCGCSHLTFRSIEGRVNDMIITTDGTALSGVGIDNYYEKEIIPRLSGVPEYLKLIQEKAGDFTVELFRREGMTEGDLTLVEERFRSLLGYEAGIRIKSLDIFPEQKKWKNVESRLAPEDMVRLIAPRTA
ncbi:MAG: hypothetical protein SA339_04455 [Methanomassiliicoccus sp.]|nr:hypothetical protein [Methanomassiliicoccus sp.]